MSAYVRGLRAKVGHDLLLMPAVAARIRDDDGRFLLVRHVEGRWQLPGGAIDPGERPEDALARECREEASVEVDVQAIVGAFGGPDYWVTYENGDKAAFVTVVYDARVVGGELRPGDDEIQEIGWFTRDEIDELEMARPTRATLRAL
jgi:ADP-ribose pyrophosphatase YjhB (NUDIX family)